MSFISNKYRLSLLLATLAILSFILRYRAFQQTDFINGWDGYFYLIQLRAWLETGTMHSPDVSLIYPLMASVNFFVEDYLSSYKISAAILTSFFVVIVFFLSHQWSKNIALSIYLASFALFSPQLTYFAAQYPKNLLGVVLFLAFLWSLSSKWTTVTIGLLLVNYFGHRLSFGMALIVLLLYLLVDRFSWRQLLQAALVIVVILLIGWNLPGVLHWTDRTRFEALLTQEMHFSPWSFVQEFGMHRLTYTWIFEIAVACLIFFTAFLFVFKKLKQADFIALLVLCSVLVFPFLQWSLTGFSYRFFLVFVLLSPLLINFYAVDEKLYNSIYLVLALMLVSASFFSIHSYNPSLHDPNYRKYAKITEKATAVLPKQTELLIAHNALAEYFTYTTKIDAMPWLPEYELDSTALWRIAADVRAPLINHYLSEAEKTNTFRLALRYYLIREDTWQKMLATIKEEDLASYQELFTWRNPHRLRPNYLLRKKKEQSVKAK